MTTVTAMDTLPVYIQYLLAALVIMVCRLTTLSCAHLLWLWLSMAVPIEKKKKTKWYVTLKPLKHVSKFVYGPYFRPKRDFLLPFSDMKWWCPYEAKKCPIPYVGSREHKPHPISDQKGLSLHPISDQKRSKPLPFGATHTIKFRK